MAKKDGKAAVVGVIAAAAAAAADPAAEQLDMLAPPTRPSLTARDQERVETAIKHDRAGRPKGATNIAKREMLDFLRKTMGDPMMNRFRWAMHTPESLAIELGCTKLEAFDRLDRMWSELCRYFYAQLAQQDSQGNAVAPRLTMVFPGQSAPQIGANGAPMAPWLYIEQNQSLAAPADDVSHDDVSHDADK